MKTQLVHVGIAVKSLAASVPVYSALFPQDRVGIEEVPDQGVRVAFFRTGSCSLELTEATEDTSPIRKFIDKRGEGVHHLSFEVPDIGAELGRLQAAGFRLIDEKPRIGAGGCLVVFIHPSSTNGVLIELSQKPGDA
ncbi:MAG TPA: methylmalonyl-CoA epimerase [Bacteroidota bacterium]|nr:methylmalonyl-CoA epimerase [Bacteroidota bacterium]